MPNHRTWSQAFAEEKALINIRSDVAAPNLVGLAISGGGIRSATFGLGVLSTLKRLGVLKHVNYLSTVSGGGYIGAWLSANCKRHGDWLEPAADWNSSIGHLRRYSNYLSPKVGFMSADTWSMAAVWFRNTLLIQTTVILGIACALLVPRPLFELFQHWPQVGGWRWTTVVLFVLGIVGVAGNQMRLTSQSSVPLLRAKSWRVGLLTAGISLAAAWLYGSWVDFDPFHGGVVSYGAAAPIAALLVLAGFLLQPVGVRLVASVWPDDSPPQQINYTQNWVQSVVVIPLIVAGYLMAAVLWGEARGTPGVVGLNTLGSYGDLATAAWRYWPFPLSIVFVSFWLLAFCAIHSRTDWKGLVTACWAPLVAVSVFHALLSAIMLLLHHWAEDPAAGAWKAFVWAPPLVAFAFVLAVVVLIGMMGRQSTEDVREWWSRLGAWIGIYATAWMGVAVAAVYGPQWVQFAIAKHPWTSLTASGGWLGTVIAGLSAGHSSSTSGTSPRSAAGAAKEILAKIAPFVFIAGLVIAVAFILEEILRAASGLDWSSVGAGPHASHSLFLTIAWAALAASVAAVLLMAARVDINQFSLNAFYRNRLVRCYLGATRFAPGERNPQNFTGFDGDDDLPLADLGARNQPLSGPLHIVNCALNLGGSSDLALHTRHSASFTLSPLHCGSAYESRDQKGAREELGYVTTSEYGGRSGAPTLGQAISVSGAAASPNMGYHTSPMTAFLLTLFDVRLGWWFPNPGKGTSDAPSPTFSLRYLLAELFGGANDTSRFVMISDGGHFENLAAYELVRRRCGVVIISDGECDPDLKFDGLGTLIRMCQVDFGAKIKIDVDSIRTGPTRPWSTKRWAVGTIDYGDGGAPGTLIYLKASMTGGENTSVLQYKASHPTFPHETTGDQFYGEDQFESYRYLGDEVASDAFQSLKGEQHAVRLVSALVSQAGVEQATMPS